METGPRPSITSKLMLPTIPKSGNSPFPDQSTYGFESIKFRQITGDRSGSADHQFRSGSTFTNTLVCHAPCITPFVHTGHHSTN